MATEAPTKKRAAKPEQGQLIETNDPLDKPLIKMIRSYQKIKSERDELLGTMKERLDTAMEKCIVEMKSRGHTTFVHGDFEAEICEGRTKLVVKHRDDGDGGDGDDE